MNKTDLAYFAGIIDGEGSIMLYRDKQRRTFMRVMVGNTNEWLINQLCFSFGGVKNVTRQYHLIWKPCWHWSIHGSKAVEFLKLILPYLKLKRAQAEIAIRFQERKSKARKYGKSHPKSDEAYALEEAELILSKSLNKRGR